MVAQITRGPFVPFANHYSCNLIPLLIFYSILRSATLTPLNFLVGNLLKTVNSISLVMVLEN